MTVRFEPMRCLLAWWPMLAVWPMMVGSASGQAPAPAPAAAPAPATSRPRIPPPRRFATGDMPQAGRVRIASATAIQDRSGASAIPSADALPAPTVSSATGPDRPAAGETPAPPPRLPIDTTLIPGRVVQPIDLANTLRLGGAQLVDIAVARQQINRAMALLGQARSLWLPSLFYGPTWYRADGQVQTVNGPVQTVEPQLAVRGRDGDPGQLLPGAVAGDRLSAAEQPERDVAALRRHLRADGRAGSSTPTGPA